MQKDENIKYIKTVYIQKGIVEAKIQEKVEVKPNVFSTLSKDYYIREVSKKSFGLSIMSIFFESNSKRIVKLLDEANKWADEYIEAIKGKEFKFNE